MNKEPATPSDKPVDPATSKRAMLDTLARVRRMGAGALDLLKRLKKDRSPQAMLATLEQAAEANQARRETVSARIEAQYTDIVAKKKAFATAPPARKRIIEAELASLLSRYKASERELTILLENEKVLAQTRGRIQEVTAYGMAGVSEIQIDDVIDEIEGSAEAAEARLDAVRDLEKAGRRRERESEKASLWDELGAFEAEPAETSRDDALKDLEAPEPDAPETPEPPKREQLPEQP